MKTLERSNESKNFEQVDSNFAGVSMAPPAFQLFAEAKEENQNASLRTNINDITQSGDDYFDERGNHLWTDLGNGNGIYLISSSLWRNLQQDTPTANEQGGHKDHFRIRIQQNRVAVRDVRFNSYDNKKSLGKLLESYLRAWGYGEVNCWPKPYPENDIMVTGPDENGELTIFINITPDGRIQYASLADNKFDLVNTLIHEKCHADSHFFQDEVGTPHSMDTQKGDSAEACLRHLESYWEQMNHESWKRTSQTYKVNHLQAVGSFLWWLSRHEEKGGRKGENAEFWQARFESRFNFMFGTDSPNRIESQNIILFGDQ